MTFHLLEFHYIERPLVTYIILYVCLPIEMKWHLWQRLYSPNAYEILDFSQSPSELGWGHVTSSGQ